MEKKFHFVYKTTNLINNKIYIGVHSTYELDDGYLGSGKLLRKAIEKYGRENFKKEILDFFNSKDECFDFESQLVNSEFVVEQSNYNIAIGGNGWSGGENLGKVVVIEKSTNNIIQILKKDFDTEKFSYISKGFVTAKNSSGKTVRITKERFESDDTVVGIAKNKLVVIDKETKKTQQIPRDEFDAERYNFITTGKVVAVKDGIKVSVSKDEFDTDVSLVGSTKGMVTVTDGNTFFQVSINDERYLNGELVPPSKNLVVAINKHTGERVTVSKEEFDSNENLVGNTFGHTQTIESNLKRSQTSKGKPKPSSAMRIKCPHCNKDGNRANMKRWHFDNCKFSPTF